MDRCLSENGILEAMDTWPKYGCMPDGRFIRLPKENEKDYVPYVHYDDMVEVVKGIPSLDVAPVVHAHWIWEMANHFVCSNCHSGFDVPWYDDIEDYKYCPFCPAKMDESVTPVVR